MCGGGPRAEGRGVIGAASRPRSSVDARWRRRSGPTAPGRPATAVVQLSNAAIVGWSVTMSSAWLSLYFSPPPNSTYCHKRPGTSTPPYGVQLVAAAVAVAEEAGGAALEVVQTHRRPDLVVLESHGRFRILVANGRLVRVAAVHAHHPIEQRFEVAGRPVPVHRTDDRPGVAALDSCPAEDVAEVLVVDSHSCGSRSAVGRDALVSSSSSTAATSRAQAGPPT